jgi:hypothetical protein
MWKIIIQCSAESWKNSATEFKAIAAQYPLTLGSSKKMKGNEQRIMEYEIENVSEAEDFISDCMRLDGFSGTFESL